MLCMCLAQYTGLEQSAVTHVPANLLAERVHAQNEAVCTGCTQGMLLITAMLIANSWQLLVQPSDASIDAGSEGKHKPCWLVKTWLLSAAWLVQHYYSSCRHLQHQAAQ